MENLKVFTEMAHKLGAVSYTHLDVYKRQELELGLEKNISEKAMYLSYDKLEDKDTLDLIEKAKAGFMQNGGIQVMICLLYTSRCV